MTSILGTAQNFAVLGASTVTSTGATAIVGDVGVSPGTAITGFPPAVIDGTIDAGDAVAATAHADLVTAYGVIAGEASPPANNLSGDDLGGMTLLPGVYHFNTSASLDGTLTLDAGGNPNARFDFQIGTTLITSSDAAVNIINGGESDNVYFQVGSSATIGTDTAFKGNILADQSITLNTGASMLDGRALAVVGAVTMDTNQISAAEADLSLTKTAAAGPVLAGDTIAYTITVENAGPSASETVDLTDLVPANTTFVSDAQTSGPTFALTNPAVGGTGTITGTTATLALNASATFTVVVLVSPSTPAGTIISNTAEVTAATNDPNLANNTQTVSTTVATQADLSLTKTAAAGPVLAGDTLAYTITVENAGPSDSKTVDLTDVVPANTTFVSDAQTSGPAFTLTEPAVGSTGTISGTIGTLAFGASATFTVVVLVSPSTAAGTIISNTGAVTAVTLDPNPTNNSQTVTTTVATQADLSLTKTTAAGPVLAGTTVAYTITVANAGPSASQTVDLTDVVPANTTFVSDAQTSGPAFTFTNPAVGSTGEISGRIGTLALGASATFTVVVLVSPSTPAGTNISNTGTVSAATFDPNLANNSRTVTTPVATQADLSLTKTAAGGPVMVGNDITYTITVANVGPSDAQTVVMSDVVPANTTFVSDAQTSGPTFTLANPAAGGTGTVSATIGTLAFGASATFTVVVQVAPNTPDETIISNTAAVAAATFDPNLANNSQTVTTPSAPVPGADLSLTKTAAAGPVLAGDTLAYTITVSNAGPNSAESVAMSDVVPANTTFVSDAQISGPAFTLMNPAVGGTGTISGTIGTLDLGATASFTVVVLVSPSTPAGTNISNTGAVSAATFDPNLANNSQTVTTQVASQADLSLTKTAAAGPILAGDDITYTITIANAGPSDSQIVDMTDMVPDNTTFVSDAQTSGPTFTLSNPAVGGTGTISGTIGTLVLGASATFSVVVLVSPSTPDGTIISNTAAVTSATFDPDLANNSQTVRTDVATQADLSLTKTTLAGPVIAGTTIAYTITVANAGPGNAQTVDMTDIVPANTTFVSDAQTSGPTFALANPAVGGTGTISGTIGSLALGASASFTVVILVLPSTPAGTTISNTAAVTAATFDPNLANNSQIVTTTVAAQADLSLSKTVAAGPVLAGKDITYTITVANAGPSDSQTVDMTDVVPANTTFVSDVQTSGPAFTLSNPALGGTGTISGTIGTLALGASATFTVVVLVSPSTPDETTISNTAAVTAATFDPNLANNSQTVTTTAATQADLSLTKTSANGPVVAGTDITYTITVANAGPSDSQTIDMTDVLPNNTTFVSDAQTSGPTFALANPAVGGAGTISGTIGTLALNASATFTVVVLVSPSTPAGTIISNTGDVTAATFDPNLANNSQTFMTDVATEADLSLTKTAAGGLIFAGTDVTYTITVANAGPSDAQTVAMTDIVPANTTFISDAQTTGPAFTLTNPAVGGTGTITGTIGTLALGASATFTVVVLVSPSTPAGTIISNTGDVTAATFDPNLANNSQTVMTDVETEADLSLTKTATAGSVLAGKDITYTITVANAGPADSQAVAMSDIVPANTTFVSDAQTSGPAFTLTEPAVGGTGTISGTIGTLALGASATFTVVVLVSPSTTDGTMISNTAEVTAATYDPNLANNSQTVTTIVAAQADLSLSKTVAAGPVLAGTDIAYYTITVANAGPSDSQSVDMTDVVPANTTFVSDAQTSGPTFTMSNPAAGSTGMISGTIGTLALGASATFTVVVLVSPSTPDGTMVSNTAEVTAATYDPNLANNSQIVRTTVAAQADLSLTKTAPVSSVIIGNDITYTITVSNAGPSDSQTVDMTDVLPANTTFVSDAQTTGPAFTLTNPAVGDSGAITGTIGTLALGASASFTVVVLVSPSMPDETMISNTAAVSAATFDSNLANNSQTVTTSVLSPPTVVDLRRFGYHAQPTILVVSFSAPLDAAAAQNVGNYQIEKVGAPRRGHVTRVREAAYDSATNTVKLYMAHRLNVHDLYQIVITGTAPAGLRGTDGAFLDGAGAGEPGSNYVGSISGKILAGRAREAVRVIDTSKPAEIRVVRKISASAVDNLALSGRLAARGASATTLQSMEALHSAEPAAELHQRAHRAVVDRVATENRRPVLA